MIEHFLDWMEVHFSNFLVFEGPWDQASVVFQSQNLARRVKVRFYAQDVAHSTCTGPQTPGIQILFS